MYISSRCIYRVNWHLNLKISWYIFESLMVLFYSKTERLTEKWLEVHGRTKLAQNRSNIGLSMPKILYSSFWVAILLDLTSLNCWIIILSCLPLRHDKTTAEFDCLWATLWDKQWKMRYQYRNIVISISTPISVLLGQDVRLFCWFYTI